MQTIITPKDGNTAATGSITPFYSSGATVTYGQRIQFNAKPSITPRSVFSNWVLKRSFDATIAEGIDLGSDPSLTYVHNYLCDTTLYAVFDLAKI